ncbi:MULTISPECIES: NAD(P)-dependent oxidoreductase [unclassified Massilia]|uniref:NAD(P)-dependent oxidoreductase n=1 Tax=unclassified Massilia TaxID=2609279 RepID=UPI00177AFF91|nr:MULTISPECIES: NAD(P)-dependent oxidoreductase [unclassified Massilia]MBD8530894.1 NAD(P)-dependent oxidoreductase [Massilia sp. CFBP 13647]MBD8674693.1 NAD(P)-dependent oxidoreductase [Massilia sp. CFBP 13721]
MALPVVAFLGIGLMGRPMASRLAQAGVSLRAWNRTAAKAQALTDSGATACASIGEAVAGAAIVISMLEAGPVVGAAIEAALPGMAPGTLWIDMSSTRHDEALAFHARLTGQGMRFLDAPVSGGVPGAEAGTLAIMAGGSLHDFNAAAPVFGVLGTAQLVGPAGSGQVAKLCNQLIVGATINIVAEALLLAQAAGADPAAVREAIRGGFAGSRILELHGQRMLERNFVPGGQVKSQLKDMRNVLAAAGEAGLVLPLTAAVARSYESIEGDLGGVDHAAALLALERINPGHRVGSAPDVLP